jgi:hypothetical protein
VTSPTTIPADSGLPCAGQRIVDLKPASLSMLINKTARLLQDQGGRWVPLLHALQAERAGRLDRGQRRKGTPVTPATGEADVPDVPPPAAGATCHGSCGATAGAPCASSSMRPAKPSGTYAT